MVGQDCEQVEAIIDEIVAGNGSSPARFLLTASHPNEDVAAAVAFARSLTGAYAGDVQMFEL